MSTSVSVNTFTHSVTHVTGEMMRGLKLIILLSDLSLEKIRNDWESVELAVYTWLSSRHLEKVTLEIYSGTTDALVTRWDFDIDYTYGADDEGALWADPAAIRNAIAKAGAIASTCRYEFKIRAPGGAYVSGWSKGSYRPTTGFTQHSIGNTIGASSIASTTSYWRKAS
jgi:hypothetical protein